MFDIGDVIFVNNVKYHRIFTALVTSVCSYCYLKVMVLETNSLELYGKNGYAVFDTDTLIRKLNGNRLVVEQCIK